ncbi:MJ1255/VC2487 family glycosyltransferase [Bermanella sp. R86510]|uniref:MJ1255/VC2487 family glycosyltransferase n=1 Tax=unclassified Bermanella TaxID=2627862 RepID=UPI0037CC5189
MKILYAVQGTGNGHLSRARVLGHYLNQSDADITYLFTGRDRAKLTEMAMFGDFWYRKGLTFITQDGQIKPIKTLLNNQHLQFIKDVLTLPVDGFDLIISDFEPVSAWAGKLKGIPVLGCGHQYAFSGHTPIAEDSPISRALMKYFAPCEFSVGQHWYPYEYNILPPIIDHTLAPTTCHGKYVVYLPFEDQTRVVALLNQLNEHEFILYTPHLPHGSKGNVKIRKPCQTGFKQHLKGAKGVICNAGFELTSECIHLGVPILTKPLKGQMEQASNSLALTHLGYGSSIKNLSIKGLDAWLKQPKPRTPRPIPNVAKALSEWILLKQWHDPQLLSHQLWHSHLTLSTNCHERLAISA